MADKTVKSLQQPMIVSRLRRNLEPEQTPTSICAGDFEIDIEKHQVRIRNEKVHLTPKEFDLLVLFARSPEHVLTHEIILKSIWGVAGAGQQENLRVLIGQLRRKIDREPERTYIQTEPWIGYRFCPF
jgi:two-component system, OmpR family, KDP operon response regulator KdpE